MKYYIVSSQVFLQKGAVCLTTQVVACKSVLSLADLRELTAKSIGGDGHKAAAKNVTILFKEQISKREYDKLVKQNRE